MRNGKIFVKSFILYKLSKPGILWKFVINYQRFKLPIRHHNWLEQETNFKIGKTFLRVLPLLHYFVHLSGGKYTYESRFTTHLVKNNEHVEFIWICSIQIKSWFLCVIAYNFSLFPLTSLWLNEQFFERKKVFPLHFCCVYFRLIEF